jgi:hypothetical protein
MAKKLCKTHITQLRKVATQLAYKQTMTHTQLILSVENRQKMEEAEKLVYKAMNLLETIS